MYPGGQNEAGKDYVAILLQLCNLPSFVKAIKVKYRITCDQTHDQEADTYEFGIDKQSWGTAKLMPSSKLRSLNNLSFKLNIEILEVKFENDKNELLSTIYDQYEINQILSMAKPAMAEDQKEQEPSLQSQLDSLKTNIEQISKQLIMTEEQKNDNNDDVQEIKREIEIIKGNLNLIMNNDNSSKKEMESPVILWLRNTVKLPEYYL